MDQQLNKSMGLGAALALGVGTMIGAGIFVLSGLAASTAGPAVVVSYILAGLMTLPTALSFAELATAYPSAGGPYRYVAEAFGPLPGFLTGWCLWAGISLTSAFYSIGFAQYVDYFIPSAETPVAIGLVIFVSILTLMGGKQSAALQNITVFALVSIFGFYIIRMGAQIDHTLHTPFAPYGWKIVIDMAPVIFVSYLGFELIATAAEEIKNPKVNLPIATIGSLLLVTAIYCAVVYIATGILPHVDLGQTSTPIADTAEIVVGKIGGLLIAVGGLLATVSSANGGIMAGTRLCFAMSRSGSMPRLLSAVHPKSKSPFAAGILTAGVIIVALWQGEIRWLAGAAGFLHLCPFVLVNLALLKLRRTSGYKPVFRVPGGSAVPLLGAFFSLFLTFRTSFSDIAVALLILIPGLIIYLWYHPLPLQSLVHRR